MLSASELSSLVFAADLLSRILLAEIAIIDLFDCQGCCLHSKKVVSLFKYLL